VNKSVQICSWLFKKKSYRLSDQAQTLAELLHHDTRYSSESKVLEAGCGIGAQTVLLALNSPETHFTSVDVSDESLEAAKSAASSKGISNVTFQRADIFDLPFKENNSTLKIQNSRFKIDGLVKSRKYPVPVIPAQAGIQCSQQLTKTWTPFFNGVTTFYECIKIQDSRLLTCVTMS